MFLPFTVMPLGRARFPLYAHTNLSIKKQEIRQKSNVLETGLKKGQFCIKRPVEVNEKSPQSFSRILIEVHKLLTFKNKVEESYDYLNPGGVMEFMKRLNIRAYIVAWHVDQLVADFQADENVLKGATILYVDFQGV